MAKVTRTEVINSHSKSNKILNIIYDSMNRSRGIPSGNTTFSYLLRLYCSKLKGNLSTKILLPVFI